MNKGKYVFSQLLSFLDPFVFLRISKKYGGDKYVKTFSCWNQLAVMMFGQLSNRDYRIFEEFAYRVMAEARQCRATEIFKLGGKVYAFDSSTIDLCLSVFSWALFRKKKGGIKLHTLYDIETQIPTFFHITPARNHDTRAMDAIPYEENSFYIFDRAYNDFGRLFTIDGVGAYFVVRGKKNNDFKPMRWKRRLPAGVMSDAVGYMDGQLTMSKYPEKMDVQRSIYEMLQLVSVSLTDTVELKTLFCKPNCNIVNEPDGSTEPTLF